MNLITTVVSGAVQLIKIGSLTTVNQWTNQEVRNQSGHLIGQIERGAEHSVRKLGLIKKD